MVWARVNRVMCDPTGISEATIALSVASAAASTAAQYQQASAQQHALDQQHQVQADQISQQASQHLGERVRQARENRARMLVAAGESGVSGNSFEAQLSNSLFQQSYDNAATAKQSEWNQQASASSYKSALAGIYKPTAIGAGLQIATAGAAAYGNEARRSLYNPRRFNQTIKGG